LAVDITKPVRKIGERFGVVFNERSGSQLTELRRAQEMQQKYCLCTPAHQLTIVFTLNLTEIIKISRQFTSAMCCKNVGGYSLLLAY